MLGHRLEASRQMDVTVDDARENGQAGEVDALRITRDYRGPGGAGHGDTALIVGDQDSVGYRVGRPAVEQPRAE